MRFRLVTVFPALLALATEYGVIGRAAQSGLIDLAAIDLRDFAVDRHGSVDDRPYGGGAGMLLRAEPLLAAISQAKQECLAAAASSPQPPLVIALTPQGEKMDQSLVRELAAQDALVLLCGRYEGFDQRVLDSAVDLELSVGDYVVSGGELPALLLVDAIARLLPGVLGNSASAMDESHLEALLDFPQYTRPENHPTGAVPQVLLSGDHEQISRWRRQQALWATYQRRPDLLASVALDEYDRALLRAMFASAQPPGP